MSVALAVGNGMVLFSRMSTGPAELFVAATARVALQVEVRSSRHKMDLDIYAQR